MKIAPVKCFAGLFAGSLLGVTALAQVSNFDSLNGYAAGLEARIAGHREALFRQPSVHELSGLRLDASYTDRSIDAANDRIERDTRARRATLSYGWDLGHWGFGLAGSVESSSSDYVEVNSPAPTPLHGDMKANTSTAAVWTAAKLGALDVSAALGMGRTTHKGTRLSDIGSSRGEFDSDDVFFHVRVAYDYVLTNTMTLQPFAGLAVIEADADGFTETGTAPDRRIVRPFASRESVGNLGLRLAGRHGTWRPSASVAWFRELSVRETTLGISAINGTFLGNGVVPNTARSLFFASLRLDGRIDDAWTLGAEVNTLTGGDERQWGLQLALSRKF